MATSKKQTAWDRAAAIKRAEEERKKTRTQKWTDAIKRMPFR